MALVVVNAEQLSAGRDLQGTFEDQVSSADLLLLNKIDLVAPEELPRLAAVLHQMAPETPVIQAVYSDLDPAVLFPPDPQGLHRQRRQPSPHPTPHQHEVFESYELPVADGIAPDVLLAQLRQLNMLRAKGFVRTAHGLQVVQGVGRRLELSPATTPPPAALVGRVVVIRRASGDAAS